MFCQVINYIISLSNKNIILMIFSLGQPLLIVSGADVKQDVISQVMSAHQYVVFDFSKRFSDPIL